MESEKVEVKKTKKEKSLIYLVIFLSLIILVLICYIFYDKLYLDSNNKKDNIENKEENSDKNNSDNKEAISIDSQIVIDAMKKYNGMYIEEHDLYNKNKYNISEISNYEIVATALKNIDRSYIVSNCSNEPKKTVSFETLNSVLKDYILNKTISKDMIKYLYGESSFPGEQYVIIDTGIKLKENGLELSGSCGDEFSMEDFVNRKVISAEKDGDYLYIYEKQAFARYNGTEANIGYLVDYYKDYSRTNVLEKNLDSIEFIDLNGNVGKNSTPNWDLYNTYKYTFKLVDNNYYFQSFELSNN